MKQQINAVLSEEMTRKEFLQRAGVGALFLLGGGVILKAFGFEAQKEQRNTKLGYGASRYGS